MKTSRQLDWRCSTFSVAAAVGLSLTLALTPRTGRAADVCAGDCSGTGTVAITDIILLVNINFGNQPPSACPHGIPPGEEDVPITLIIQAVGNDLNGCGATPTPGPGGCGNGVVNSGETCDDGGTCLGGTNAGTHCTAESDCTGNGRCEGGTKYWNACASDSDCPGGTCRHCIPQGGDGCAANCTKETEITMTLKTGQLNPNNPLELVPGTSGAVIHSQIIPTVPLPLNGTQIVTIGEKGADGTVPAVIKAQSLNFDSIPVLSNCACLRGVATKTCGGTLYDVDGKTQSTDCTGDDSVCTSKKLPPCTFLHGPDNTASGTVGCGTDGYGPVDYLYDLDAGGSSGRPGDPVITLSGHGPIGSALLLSNSAIGVIQGGCTGNAPEKYGPDGTFCTDDDPQDTRGTPSPLILATGTTTGTLENANGVDGNNRGPFATTGTPLDCNQLLNNHSVSNASLAAAFVSLKQPQVADIIVTSNLVGE
jgi:hypothetical protein